MKQVVQNYKSGELALLDVPEPACKPGGVLVRTLYSLISTGTELMKVSEASKSLLGKAKARPDQVAKVMQSVATNGLAATYRKVTSKLDSYTPLGYSLCGVVTAVGDGITDVSVGSLVACAGNEHALHAELNWVPKNLYAPVPTALSPQHAAFGTVGSIAMQGVRQGEPQLGDVALVIGLGLIGQLVVQLLGAAGVTVIGVDPDPTRCALAESVGAALCAAPGSDTVEMAVASLTGGHGVDQVYLAAGGSTNQPVELAAKLSRDRGTVVDIGKCSLNLPWNAYYEKELSVRFSRSYGPGRYDPSYELEGRDYPIGYVRWTERRNLECFLDLAARDKIDVSPLITHVAGFDDAVETYRSLNDGELKAVAVLFAYPQDEAPELSALADNVKIEEPSADERMGLSNGNAADKTSENGTTNGKVEIGGLPGERMGLSHGDTAVDASENAAADGSVEIGGPPAAPMGLSHGVGNAAGLTRQRSAVRKSTVRIGFIGAGNYASSMLLPHLAENERADLHRVVTTSALSGANAKRKFGFRHASTEIDDLLGDDSVDAVFVVTRHSSHAALTNRALRAGKAVFVEKPLALSDAEFDSVRATIDETGNDRLQVGFNRRFAPLLNESRRQFGRRVGPASVRYLVNAGSLDGGSWYTHGAEGSRFAGEGGHFIDTVSWMLADDPVTVYATATPGHTDLQVVLTYPDGSTAAVTYTTTGSSQFQKETIDFTADGKVLRFDDFARAAVYGRKKWVSSRLPKARDKGQAAELREFVDAVASGAPMPVPFDSLAATTLATLAVETSLGTGVPVHIRELTP
ncbi:bi-domain-containing oxidoreductase [Actinophytocola algeriensis]|uniref:Putative dehydrogenase/threonine dehydrogenase-like Zn-dependent dehydrogenase n=1 Tax=Actinophytocola algeriensis TaxID=1768010 RepID=A0A7W7VIS4_9PSEU|nr:bi-domain-containing oxidoreductase [Actinophytocola algeriensis]MBB4911758.1 putative dehydrogenase/threonine dehydrogenase-like Zn-dependent dehydrogenase [Actinophytocola algeriensis]MBE1477750.1 putative dehydrogenase/threonine dehydrogenase-like Zn-dependent dehydrogenase [Actinophytocola algeriensis]